MKILHLAAGNRWTGAAAPAFAEVAALREGGVDAHYAYVGGYKLEAKLRHLEFTHPLIEKAQNPASFVGTSAALTALVRRLGIDIVHAHLTYDHWLARMVAFRTGARLARTFHARRVLRSDPFTLSLIRSTRAIFAINETFTAAPPIRSRDPQFTPPPVDLREFTQEGPDARAQYGIDRDTPLLVMIGKLSAGRGFEAGLHTLAAVRRAIPAVRMMIIGHGEHRPRLESLAQELGVTSSVVWAGYHEDDLAAHYRSGDALLFTAQGSDEGHRAVIEAMACGLPPVVAPIEGVAALIRGFEERLLAAAAVPEAMALRTISLLESRGNSALRSSVGTHAASFSYRRAAERLVREYEQVM